MKKLVIFLFLGLNFCDVICSSSSKKKPKPYTQVIPNVKYDNPNFVRDRWRRPNSTKPQMPTAWLERFKRPFHPAWMDYCDPYHCNDYHKITCGLNRKTMRFKWFQSSCHLILNNMCSNFRGLLRYDIVDTKYCTSYVMQVRSGCPASCERDVAPVCALARDGRLVLFQNRCAFDRANCGFWIEPFDEVIMDVCEYQLSAAL